MNEPGSKRNIEPRIALISSALALLLNTGCTTGEASETLHALGRDLALQLATFWLL